MPRRVIALCTVAAVVATFSAIAAGTFDGEWEGAGKATPACSEPADFTVTVVDNKIVKGSLIGPKGATAITKGDIRPDGLANIAYGKGNLKGALKFEGDQLSGQIDTLCGKRELDGKRIKRP
jgi:hypothetical protein